jgi:hypothetical protein
LLLESEPLLLPLLSPNAVSTRSASPKRYPDVAAHNNGCILPLTLKFGLCAHNEFSSPSFVDQKRTLPPTSLGMPPVIKKYLLCPVKCTNNIFDLEVDLHAFNTPSVQSPRWDLHIASVQLTSLDIEAIRLPSCENETHVTPPPNRKGKTRNTKKRVSYTNKNYNNNDNKQQRKNLPQCGPFSNLHNNLVVCVSHTLIPGRSPSSPVAQNRRVESTAKHNTSAA